MGKIITHACTLRQMSFTHIFWGKKRKEKKINIPTRLIENMLFFSSSLMKSPYIAAEVQIATIPVKWGCATEYRSWSGSPSKSISKKILGVCENRDTARNPFMIMFDLGWRYICILFVFCRHIFDYTYLKLHIAILLWCCDKQQTGS